MNFSGSKSSLYPLRDGVSDWAVSPETATSVRAVRASFVLHLFVVSLFLGYVAYFILLGTVLFDGIGSMATWYGSIVATTATQL